MNEPITQNLLSREALAKVIIESALQKCDKLGIKVLACNARGWRNPIEINPVTLRYQHKEKK